jgi:hypothetical protein
MLHWDPNKRATAEKMLKSPWLTMEANYETKVAKPEDATIQTEEDYYF